MAKLESRRFIPIGDEVINGAVSMTKEEILEALKAYKAQNPAKYEAKKAALFKRYGLDVAEEIPAPEPDASDIELEAITAKVKKASRAKKATE